MSPGFGPGQRRIVERVSWFADVHHHVPRQIPLVDPSDQTLLEEVVGCGCHLSCGQFFHAVMWHETPLHRMRDTLRIQELKRMNAEVRGLVIGRSWSM